MPGYARQTGGGSKTAIFSNGTQVYSEKFYGFKYNLETGQLLIDEIDNKSKIVSIPEEEGDYNSEYAYWIWSGTKLKFNWDTGAESNRLLMEVT